MRRSTGWKVALVGVALTLVGAVTLFVPIVSQGDQVLHVNPPAPGAGSLVENLSGFSIIGYTPVMVSWSSSNGVYASVLAAVCQAPCSGNDVHGPITYENGSSGSLTLNPPNGWGIVLIVSIDSVPASVTFRFVAAASTIGTCFLVGGEAFLIAGVVLRSKWKPPLPI